MFHDNGSNLLLVLANDIDNVGNSTLDIKTIFNYFEKSARLKINEEKTKYMYFSGKTNTERK